VKIGDLFITLGFKADETKLSEFIKQIGDLNLKSVMTTGAFGVLVNKTKEWIEIAEQSTFWVNKFGRETGMSKQEVQKWTKVAERMGVEVDTIVGGLKTLQSGLFQLQMTGEGSNVWMLLGLDPRTAKNNFELLKMIGSRLEGLNFAQKRFILGQLGLGDEWLNVFPEILKNQEDLIDDLAVGETHLEAMHEYHKENVRLGQELNKVWTDIGASIARGTTHVTRFTANLISAYRKSDDYKAFFDADSQVSKEFWKNMLNPLKYPMEDFKKMLHKIPSLKTSVLMTDPFLSQKLRSQIELKMREGNKERKLQQNVQIHAHMNIQGDKPEQIANEIEKKIERMSSDTANQLPGGGY